MNPIDEIFIIDKPLPFIPSDNPVSLNALQNVIKKGKGLLPGFMPLYAQGSLNINVKRYFTDSNGTVVTKAAAIAAKPALNTSYPVYLLGNFDRIGAYNIGQKTVGCRVPFLMTYVHGVSNPFLYNSGFNDVINNFKQGDIITVYVDDINNPSYYVFVVQTVDYGSLASIITNTSTQQQDGIVGQLHVKNIAYQVDVENQLQQVWQMVTFDNLGQFEQKPLNPIVYKQPLYRLSDFITLPVSFLMTQFTGINFPMDITSDSININFRISK